MQYRNKRHQISKQLSKLLLLFAAILCLPVATVALTPSANDLIRYSLSDIRVAYLYDNASEIDWPTIYYINDHHGCRVDLVNVRESYRYDISSSAVADRQLFLHRFGVNLSDSSWVTELLSDLFDARRVDIVIGGELGASSPTGKLFNYLKSMAPTSDRIFNITKIYRLASGKTIPGAQKFESVVLNRIELFQRYKDRIENEVVDLLDQYEVRELKAGHLARYELIGSRLGSDNESPDFVSGLEHNRLTTLIDSLFSDGPRRKIVRKQAGEFLSLLSIASRSDDDLKVQMVVDGYRKLGMFYRQKAFEGFQSRLIDLSGYLENLHARVEVAALRLIGLNWEGKIITRESPHGPRVKFRATIGAGSPVEIEVQKISFVPYWDSSTVLLQSEPLSITPHQTMVREYLVDIPAQKLESDKPDSLTFLVEIVYRGQEMTLSSSLPVWEQPELSVKFVPEYYFIPPFKRVDVDRVISPMAIQVVIEKPKNFGDTVHLDLKTPRGIFAGSYRSEHYLPKGTTRKTIRIPFSITKLFEMGIQSQRISLQVDGKEIAADTGAVRIASCNIDSDLRIGYLSDSDGSLEDVLRMTRAAIEPLTDQTIMNYNLSAYDVIVVGTGALKSYPSLRKIKDKIQDYISNGGSLVLMSQPEGWPEGILPVSFTPVVESVDKNEIVNRIQEANILSRPYSISDKNLFSSFYRKREIQPAVIAPAEIVYKTNSGAALLSVSRLGSGQVIFCGLPLLEMVSRLDIDAIHLLANILNY